MSKFKWLLGVIALLCVLIVGMVVMRLLPVFFPGPPKIINTSTILKQVQTLSEVVTVKYVLEKVVILDDPSPYLSYLGKNFLNESRVMLVAHGVVKAGFDFQNVKPTDIRITGKKIVFELPPPIVTDAYLDDHKTQVIERSTGILRSFDKDLEQNARNQAVQEMSSMARKQGITDEAVARAKAQFTSLFHQLGFEEVEIRTK